MNNLFRFKNPSIYIIGFGFCNIIDGLIMILSLGIIRTQFAMYYALHGARKGWFKRS